MKPIAVLTLFNRGIDGGSPERRVIVKKRVGSLSIEEMGLDRLKCHRRSVRTTREKEIRNRSRKEK